MREMATLIVFVHGFLGSKSDFAGLCPIVERTLTNNKEVEHGDEQEKDKGKQLILHIIRANFTSWFLTGTWDGADRGGESSNNVTITVCHHLSPSFIPCISLPVTVCCR